jgi:hypothetical protein
MEQMIFLYTALGRFDKTSSKDGIGWDKYVEWSKLTHLTEVVSLDGMLNKPLVDPDYNDAEDWNFIHCIGLYQTGFFKSQEYVLRKCKNYYNFNLLTVVISPSQDCKYIQVDDYEFMGYELLDHEFGVSVLTNCGGFDETFLPTDLNNYGLIDEYLAAYDIRKRLLENNPEEPHTKTNVIAVWRHNTIGRK